MSVTIERAGDKYTIEDYEWTGPDDRIVKYLESLLPFHGPSGSNPNPDLVAAQEAAAAIGAEVVEVDQPENALEEGVQY